MNKYTISTFIADPGLQVVGITIFLKKVNSCVLKRFKSANLFKVNNSSGELSSVQFTAIFLEENAHLLKRLLA